MKKIITYFLITLQVCFIGHIGIFFNFPGNVYAAFIDTYTPAKTYTINYTS